MVIHIALFAWKSDVSPAQIVKALQDVRDMKSKVPGIVDIYCGENFSRWNEGFTHAFVVLTRDRASLDAYRNHPDHVAVGHLVDSMETKSIGIDFCDPPC